MPDDKDPTIDAGQLLNGIWRITHRFVGNRPVRMTEKQVYELRDKLTNYLNTVGHHMDNTQRFFAYDLEPPDVQP